MPRSLSSRARGHETLAAAFIDAIGNRQEGLDARNAAGHRVGEENVAAVRDQFVDLGHDLGRRIGEAAHADGAACFDLGPVELLFLPILEGNAREHFRRVLFARRRVEVETGHHRHVDDASAQFFLGFGQLFVVQGAQGVVLIAAADGDADDRHAGGTRFIDQAVHIAAPEQLAEQDEDVALAEGGRLRDMPQGIEFGHCSCHSRR